MADTPKKSSGIGNSIGAIVTCVAIAVLGFAITGDVGAIGVCIGIVGLGAAAICVWELNNELVKRDKEKKAAAEQAAKEEQFRQEHPHHDAEKFFKKCRTAGVKEHDSRAGVARIEQVARNEGVNKTGEELVAFYLLGKTEVKKHEAAAARAKREEKLAELREEEQELQAELEELVPLHGTEKTAKAYENLYYEASLERAAAAGKQNAIINEGVQIRQLGRELGTNIYDAGYLSDSSKRLFEYGRQADLHREVMEFYSKKKENARNLLVEDTLDMQELLALVQPTVLDWTFTESGAVRLQIGAQRASITIYDDVSAIVDGHIRAVLVDKDGNRLGTASFSLPVEIIYPFRERTKAEAICLGPVKEKALHDIIFEPIDLWGREVEKK